MELQRLTRDRVGELARVLAAAFRATPAFAAALGGDEGARAPRLEKLFRTMAGACCRHGAPTVILDGSRVAGASLAYPPGGYPFGPLAWLESGAGALLLGPRATINLARLDAHLRARHATGSHWYLYVLGVDPALQGRGLGGALLRKLAADADRARVITYLETDDPDNVGLYQRFGFQVTSESRVAALGVTFWHMVRPATPGPTS